MVISMTGFGNAVVETPDLLIRVEIKSLNSRGLDLSIRVPKNHSEKEITMRPALSNRLQRGKVTITIDAEATAARNMGSKINEKSLVAYYRELKKIADTEGASAEHLFPALLALPDISQPAVSVEDAASETEWAEIEKALHAAIEKFEAFRVAEGATLHTEIASYIHNIGACLEKIVLVKDSRIEKIRADLREKLDQVLEEGRVDETRLEQELIYYTDKLDITEEIVRLGSHLKYFLETMDEPSPGKKLGFISQEIGREINTIGSKSNDAVIQKDIVIMKEELEKIKEQCLNVL